VLPPTPDDEARLSALHRYNILDTDYEQAFDDLARLAADICETPIALISLVDRERQWFKAAIGTAVRETPRDISFCSHAIRQSSLFVVSDMLRDERFRDNPLVTGEPHLRFYAGAILESSDGYPLGTLCVLDHQPRTLTDRQLHALRILAREVMTQLELRLRLREQETLLEERRKAAAEREEGDRRFRIVADSMPQLVWATDADGSHIYYNRRWYEYTGLSEEESLGFGFANALHPDDVERTLARWRRAWAGGESYEIEYRFRRHDGVYRWFVGRAEPVRALDSDEITMWVGTCTDIDDQKKAEDAVRLSEARHRFLFDSAHLGVVYRDSELRAIELNAAAERILGIPREKMLGRDMQGEEWQAIHPDGTPFKLAEAPAAIALHTGRRVSDVLVGLYHAPEGRYRWLNVTAQPLFREGSPRPAFVYSVYQDVTEEREAREALSAYATKQARVAETLQEALLLTPAEDAFPGVRIKTVYEAAWDEALLGGDFYDAFALSEEQVALVVGDVSGKGLKAAAFTAEVKFALRALLREHRDPAEALTRLNQFIADSQRLEGRADSALVALCAAVLNTVSGDVTISSGGAEPPLIVRTCTRRTAEASECPPEEVAAFGPLIGMDAGGTFTRTNVRLTRGDLLLMFTDGLTEARRPPQNRRDGDRLFFGPEGVAETARETGEAPVSMIAEAVVTEAKSFAGGKLRDDVCLLVAAFQGRQDTEPTE
jgi:PAS domain S-box-containing protein